MSNMFHQIGDTLEKSMYFKSCFYILTGALLIYIGYIVGKWVGSVVFKVKNGIKSKRIFQKSVDFY